MMKFNVFSNFGMCDGMPVPLHAPVSTEVACFKFLARSLDGQTMLRQAWAGS